MATPAPTVSILRQRALSLGTANAIDYGLQFLLPVMLTRCLPTAAFGEYRLVWLVIMTVMTIAPLQMPAVLYYFLPRSTDERKRLHVHQTLLYLILAGSLGAAAASSLNPLLPESVRPLARLDPLLPLLVLLYTVSVLLDSLPTVEERIAWQARVNVAFSLVRTATLAGVAWLTGDIGALLVALALLLAAKVALLIYYIRHHHGLRGNWLDAQCFGRQLKYAAPFGAAAALYGLRGQADQWVAALNFTLQQFAAFSIATVLGPLVNLFRQSINHVFLPSMSRLHAANDLKGMAALNSRANVSVALLVYPFLAIAFIYAEALVALVYSPAYITAAPVMRLHVLGMAILIIEVSSLMLLQQDGPFAIKLNLALMAGSVTLSLVGAQLFGLVGAALGSNCAVLADRVFSLRRIAKTTGIPVHALQDWAALGRLVLIALLSGIFSWQLVLHWLPAAGDLVRLTVGGTALLLTYAGALTVYHRWAPPPLPSKISPTVEERM